MTLESEANAVERELHAIALQVYNLAMGLQNAAPPQVKEVGSQSIPYLREAAILFEQRSQLAKELIPEGSDTFNPNPRLG